MDQVKQYLQVALKYHFWILCAVVAVLTLGSWYMATAALRKQFTDNKGKISSAESIVTALASEREHPNRTYATSMDLIIAEYKEDLKKIWEQQYEEQGKNLVWPKRSAEVPEGLSPEFVEQVEVLRPIETTVKYDPTVKNARELLDDNFRGEYTQFVKYTALPNLAKIIGAVWAPALDTGAAGTLPGVGRTGGETTTDLLPSGEKVIVDWDVTNQGYLQEKRFDWRLQPNGRPTTLQILYAQEDIWVMETIMKIIAKTNSDADARHNAIVKRIKYLKLGVDAVGFSGEVTKLVAASANPTTPGQPTVPGGPVVAPPSGPPTTDPRAGVGNPYGPGGATNSVSVDPAADRYVDNTFKPIAPGRLRDAFKSTDPNEVFLAVAKRMPVRMHLTVDQRQLHRLLAECGNSNLIVEVRQIRINRPIFDGTSSSGGTYGPTAGGERGYPGGSPGGVAGGIGGGVSRPPVGPTAPPRGVPGRDGGYGGGSDSDAKPHFDIDVELYGMVYIYNPVNEGMVAAITAGADVPPPPATTPSPTTPPATTTPPAATTPPTNTTPAPPAPMNTTPMPTTPMNTTPAPPTPMNATPMNTTPMPAPTN